MEHKGEGARQRNVNGIRIVFSTRAQAHIHVRATVNFSSCAMPQIQVDSHRFLFTSMQTYVELSDLDAQ